jgi:hypothetical protein
MLDTPRLEFYDEAGALLEDVTPYRIDPAESVGVPGPAWIYRARFKPTSRIYVEYVDLTSRGKTVASSPVKTYLSPDTTMSFSFLHPVLS